MRKHLIAYKDRFYLTFWNPDILLKATVDIYTQKEILIKFNNKQPKPVEINKGVRQGCPFSPTLFNVYLDEIITKWQKQDVAGMEL